MSLQARRGGGSVALGAREAVGAAEGERRERPPPPLDPREDVGPGDAEDPLVRAHPEPSAVRLEDLEDLLVGEAVGGSDGPEAPVAPEEREAARRADPEEAFRVLVEGEDDVAREAVPRVEDRQDAVLQPGEPPRVGPDPDHAVPADEEAPDDVAREAVRTVQDRERPPVEPGDPRPVRADPDVLSAAGSEGVDDVRREAVLLRVPRERPVGGEADQPGSVRPDPQDVPRSRDDGADRHAAERRHLARDDEPFPAKGRDAAGVGPGPERPVRRLRDRADVLVGKPFALAENGDLPVPEAVQPAVRADPDAPLAVLADRADEGVQEALGHAEPLDPFPGDPHEPRPVAPDPQGAVPVPVERPEELARQAVLLPAHAHRSVFAGLHEAETVEGRRDAARRGRERVDGAGGPARRRVDAADRLPVPPEEAVRRGPDPEAAGRVGEEAPDRRPLESAGKGDRTERGPVEPGQATVRARPEGSPGVLGESPGVFRGEPLALAVAGEDTPARADDTPAERTDPERPETVLQDRPRAVAPEGGRVPRVVDDEGDPVESDEPLVGPEPEVAVPGLQDRVDAVLREPVLPGVEPVLRERRRGIERERALGGEEQGRREDATGEEPPQGHPADSDPAAPRARDGRRPRRENRPSPSFRPSAQGPPGASAGACGSRSPSGRGWRPRGCRSRPTASR